MDTVERQLNGADKQRHKKKHHSKNKPDKHSKKKDKRHEKRNTRLPPIVAISPPSDNLSNTLESFMEEENAQTYSPLLNKPRMPRGEMSDDDDDNDDAGEEEDDEENEALTVSMDEDMSSTRGENQQERIVLGSLPGVMLLNDDEHFDLEDNIVRRTIYAAYKSAKLTLVKPRIMCINLTKQHFEPGATKWYHLKDIYYDLLTTTLNSIVFARGKKVKLTPAEKQPDGGSRSGVGNRTGRGVTIFTRFRLKSWHSYITKEIDFSVRSLFSMRDTSTVSITEIGL